MGEVSASLISWHRDLRNLATSVPWLYVSATRFCHLLGGLRLQVVLRLGLVLALEWPREPTSARGAMGLLLILTGPSSRGPPRIDFFGSRFLAKTLPTIHTVAQKQRQLSESRCHNSLTFGHPLTNLPNYSKLSKLTRWLRLPLIRITCPQHFKRGTH